MVLKPFPYRGTDGQGPVTARHRRRIACFRSWPLALPLMLGLGPILGYYLVSVAIRLPNQFRDGDELLLALGVAVVPFLAGLSCLNLVLDGLSQVRPRPARHRYRCHFNLGSLCQGVLVFNLVFLAVYSVLGNYPPRPSSFLAGGGGASATLFHRLLPGLGLALFFGMGAMFLGERRRRQREDPERYRAWLERDWASAAGLLLLLLGVAGLAIMELAYGSWLPLVGFLGLIGAGLIFGGLWERQPVAA